MYKDGVPPAWPPGFSDRLFVIPFSFTKNEATGTPMITGNDDVNYSQLYSVYSLQLYSIVP